MKIKNLIIYLKVHRFIRILRSYSGNVDISMVPKNQVEYFNDPTLFMEMYRVEDSCRKRQISAYSQLRSVASLRQGKEKQSQSIRKWLGRVSSCLDLPILRPSSWASHLIDLVVMVIILTELFWIPFKAAFKQDIDQAQYQKIQLARYFSFALLCLHLVVQFHIGYYDEGILILRKS